MRNWLIYWYSKQVLNDRFLRLGGTRLNLLSVSMRHLPVDNVYINLPSWRTIDYTLISYSLLPRDTDLKANRVGPRAYNLGLNLSLLEVKDALRLAKKTRTSLTNNADLVNYPVSEWGILGHSKTQARYGNNLIYDIRATNKPIAASCINQLNCATLSPWEFVFSLNPYADLGLALAREATTYPVIPVVPQQRVNRVVDKNSYIIDYSYTPETEDVDEDISSEILDDIYPQISLQNHCPSIENISHLETNYLDQSMYLGLYSNILEYPTSSMLDDSGFNQAVDMFSSYLKSIDTPLKQSADATKLILEKLEALSESAAIIGMSTTQWSELTEVGLSLLYPGLGVGSLPYNTDTIPVTNFINNLTDFNSVGLSSTQSSEHRTSDLLKFPQASEPHYNINDTTASGALIQLNMYITNIHVTQLYYNQLALLTLN